MAGIIRMAESRLGSPSARRLVSLRRARTTLLSPGPTTSSRAGRPNTPSRAAFTPSSGAAWKFSTSDLGQLATAPPPRLSARCRIGEVTFAVVFSRGGLAP